MTLTPAVQEAYAFARPGRVIYETLELQHVTFATPVRIVTGVSEDMSFPIEAGGDPVLFQACQVSVTRPGVNEDGPTPAKVTIDNVSALLRPYILDAIQASTPITVIYRAYTSEDLTQPGDVIDGLELWDVDLDATAATGTLKYRELELQAFPLCTYDATYYPALQDA